MSPGTTPPAQPPEPESERRALLVRAMRKWVSRLVKKRRALEGDLAEAARAGEWRRFGETLLAYAHQVPPRADVVSLADVAEPARLLSIPLDPAIAAPANAARYFKRAAKAERGQREIPPRLAALAREIAALEAPLAAALDADPAVAEPAMLELERALFALTATQREQIHAPQPLPRKALGLGAPGASEAARKGPTTSAPQRGGRPPVPPRLVPRRLRTREGWDVMIGRSSDGNDYLTAHLARPEDYWFHAHGCSGSHVVLRRGKGRNEPSKATLEEVASWSAFYSQARNAGKVPVIYTQKKYVRKPRGAKAGLVHVEREKLIMARPVEPPREALADEANLPPMEDA